MDDVLLLSAEQLLSLPVDQPERLFAGDQAAMRHLYRRLAAKWHPDHNDHPAAPLAFDRLRQLYQAACQRLEELSRRGPGIEEFESDDGRTFRLQYLRRHHFELGEMFIANHRVVFRIQPEHQDLWENGLRRIEDRSFADEAMQREMERYLPRLETHFMTAKGPVTVLHKDPGLVLLRDLVQHLGGKLDPRHAAWVLSSLHNLACYLEFAGLSHNAISAETYFVSPAGHFGALLGGWWYVVPVGSRLRALPSRTAEAIPGHLVADRQATVEIDLELIKALGRELLGDERGIGFLARPDIPQPLFNAVRLPAAEDAVSAYQQWQNVLTSSFGKRRFVELAVTPQDVYKEH